VTTLHPHQRRDLARLEGGGDVIRRECHLEVLSSTKSGVSGNSTMWLAIHTEEGLCHTSVRFARVGREQAVTCGCKWGHGRHA